MCKTPESELLVCPLITLRLSVIEAQELIIWIHEAKCSHLQMSTKLDLIRRLLNVTPTPDEMETLDALRKSVQEHQTSGNMTDIYRNPPKEALFPKHVDRLNKIKEFVDDL